MLPHSVPHSYDNAALKHLQAAYDKACVTLGLDKGSIDETHTSLAKVIMSLAPTGEQQSDLVAQTAVTLVREQRMGIGVKADV
jgi:hypothetical protein